MSVVAGEDHIVFSGNIGPIDALADFARGADLLVHEATLEAALPALITRVGNGNDRLREHWMRSHTTPRASHCSPASARALNYLIPSDDPAYTEADWRADANGFDGTLHVGRDGLVIRL